MYTQATRVTLASSTLLYAILSSCREDYASSEVTDVAFSDHSLVLIDDLLDVPLDDIHNEETFGDYKQVSHDMFLLDLSLCEPIVNTVFNDSDLIASWASFKKSFISISNRHVSLRTHHLRQ